ncbi:MAG: hypothetical protein H6839_07190 [Planctomycetes bacterium]|nr:hypothetical protein [Planctomycetota bacterium]
MNKLTCLLALIVLSLAGCQNSGTGGGGADGGSCGGGFGDDGSSDGGEVETPTTQIVLERSDVQLFRGTEMVKLLKKMDSPERDDWLYVRRHVFPPPTPPYELDEDGKLVRKNYQWPPADMNKLSPEQKKWKSYLLWPDFIRELLQQRDWDREENRTRLANYGFMFELLQDFQTREPYASQTRESEYWSRFAESMLAYGEDGQNLLIANMIVAFSNPLEDVVYNAQSILVQIGTPAIQPLCAAMWTSHRQMIQGWEEDVDPDDPTGVKRIRTQVYKVVGNPNYNRYIEDTLFRIGPLAVQPAITELTRSVDKNGKAVGPMWRYRKYFVDLLGRFGDKRALPVLEDEIDRVVVQEYDEKALAEGKLVVDEQSTDDAEFTWHEYLIKALGQLGDPEALRPIIKLWKKDEFHEVAAIGAIQRITGRSVRSIAAARELATALKVDLKGE